MYQTHASVFDPASRVSGMSNSKSIDRFIDANDVIIGDPGDESLNTFLEKTPLLDLVTHSDIPSEISIKSILGLAIS